MGFSICEVLPMLEFDLVLDGMGENHPGLTPALADALAQAARVCLARHHSSPTDFDIRYRGRSLSCTITWDSPTTRERAANGNELDATRDAAYSISFAAIEKCDDLVVVARAEHMSGSDFYIGPRSSDPGDLEDALRLEVSGTDVGDRRECVRRLDQKRAQANNAGHPIPAIASVVGLNEALILVADC
jgi:hypothetical protein